MNVPFLNGHWGRRALIAVLGVAAAAGMVAGREKPAPDPIAPVRALAEPRQADFDLDLGKLARADVATSRSDPFAPRSFAPPAPVQKATARVAPSAPPLPFIYLGKITQGGNTELLLMRGEELISIAAGDQIDGQYRVDAISESSVDFTYLPLKMRQSLALPEAAG